MFDIKIVYYDANFEYDCGFVKESFILNPLAYVTE